MYETQDQSLFQFFFFFFLLTDILVCVGLISASSILWGTVVKWSQDINIINVCHFFTDFE